MATSKAEGNKSGGSFPESQKSSKLFIQPLERVQAGEDQGSSLPKPVNLLLCALALCVLYGYYILFGWAWLTAMTELGDDLNWAFFGLMVSVGSGMMGGVAYSMKSQRKGVWAKWTKRTKDDGTAYKPYKCGSSCNIWNVW